MAAPELTLVDPKRYEVNEIVEVLEGDDRIIILLPATVPAGKKVKARVEVRARLFDA